MAAGTRLFVEKAIMRRYYKHIFICLGLLYLNLALNDNPAGASISELFSKRLRSRIDTGLARKKFTSQSERICGSADMLRFYNRRGYHPAWIGSNSDFPLADELIQGIYESVQEGLTPSIYHLKQLQSLLNKVRHQNAHKQPVDLKTLMDLEILLTNTFILLGSHLRGGRVNPEKVHAQWVVNNPGVDMAAILQSAIESQKIRAAFKKLLPPHQSYMAMRTVLAKYRKILTDGGWPVIPAGASLRLGDHGRRVTLLRQRLVLAGDLQFAGQDGADQFDGCLASAVRRFQIRHGLTIDGVVGRKTRASLNVSVSDRIRQIEMNMERWRSIPHNLGQRFFLVNIAGFKLTVFENNQPVMDMRVVVGRSARRTPVFSARLKYMVLNPYWYIPSQIAVKDILPQIKNHIGYLLHRKIRIFASWDKDANELDPDSIDWSQFNQRLFPFKLRQDPSPLNALGRIKFILPNQFDVYLHDTPAKQLFLKTSRDFSSGCIRLQRPIDLAAYLLQNRGQWSRDAILQTIKSGQRKIIRIQDTVFVHLFYWTAWVDKEGMVHFRKDIYTRDKSLERALKLENEKLRRPDFNDEMSSKKVLAVNGNEP